MNKQELINQVTKNHTSFIEYISKLSDKEFEHRPLDKWTAGQQLEHIYVSVSAVTQGLSVPKFAIKMIFGKANRPSRSYDELVKKYLDKLNSGGKASGRFIPKAVPVDKKEKLLKSLSNTVTSLASKINNYSEEELDTILLPHPLLGKLTVREMIYFTIHHVEQHQHITNRNLAG